MTIQLLGINRFTNKKVVPVFQLLSPLFVSCVVVVVVNSMVADHSSYNIKLIKNKEKKTPG